MTNWIDKIFRRSDGRQQQTEGPAAQTPQPLRIEGTTQAPLTPEPDEAELAAQAVLEALCEETEQLLRQTQRQKGRRQGSRATATDRQPQEAASAPDIPKPANAAKTAVYYHRLAQRIRQAHDQATLRTMRFLAFCEQELQKPHLPLEGKDSLQQMEVELMKRLDTVERVGGELKRRWQHCLATVIVRQMPPDADGDETTS